MEIFLTGATGVIGRRVLPRLVRAGHGVTAIGRTQEKRRELERQGARTTGVELFDSKELRTAVAGHDAVINLATHMPSSSLRMLLPGAWSQNDRIRREGAKNLVEAALAGGVSRFVQESFAPAYPDRGDSWIDETVALEPVRYNRTVLDAERAAERFASAGRTAVVLRFAAFYGPDSRLLGDIIGLVRRGFAPFPGPPEALISSVSHDDAAAAVVSALLLTGGAYNVADDEPVSHREYVDSLAAALGVRAPELPPAWATFLFGSAGSQVARSVRVSNRKLRAATDWRPHWTSVRGGWTTLPEASNREALQAPSKQV